MQQRVAEILQKEGLRESDVVVDEKERERGRDRMKEKRHEGKEFGIVHIINSLTIFYWCSNNDCDEEC